jgi:hypothetical protein
MVTNYFLKVMTVPLVSIGKAKPAPKLNAKTAKSAERREGAAKRPFLAFVPH